MPLITIVTGAHLCRNPRVVKEAASLAGAGYEVKVMGTVWDGALLDQDVHLAEAGGFMHRPVVDIRREVGGGKGYRFVRRVATEGVARLGLQRPEALGYGVRKLLQEARRASADLTIGHQEVGVYVAAQLLRLGHRAGADIEDWHSEDQMEDAAKRPSRLLALAEKKVLRAGAHVTTTSHALASALTERYGTPRPGVVYNTFPWADRDSLDGLQRDRTDTDRPSLHWVSQTTGPGRGLEAVCEALKRVHHPVDVHLRGTADAEAQRWLRSLFPSAVGHRLFFHDLVPPAELLSRIAEHDIGLALERYEPPSRNLTVTNKILHYLLGGLAVVATDTAGQREIAQAAPEAVVLCKADDAESMAAALNSLLADPGRLRLARRGALRAASEQFNWERQIPHLLHSIAEALHVGPVATGPVGG